MPGHSKTIIKEQTGAVTINRPYPITKAMVPCTISATNLAGSETVTISFSNDGGQSFEASFQDGSAVELTATAKLLSINSPTFLGITKSATAGLTGVFIN